MYLLSDFGSTYHLKITSDTTSFAIPTLGDSWLDISSLGNNKRKGTLIETHDENKHLVLFED